MKAKYTLVGLLTIAAILSACGPSPEEIAAQTAAAMTEIAAAWTPTPTSTPTPTPVPYDLTVSLTDLEGSPITLASIVFPESGDDTPIPVDENGMLSWTNLPSESGNLDVTAQGYYSISEPISLTRGLNESTFVLERDPLQVLPSDACGPGEKLVYLEDFQDMVAQEWPEIQFNAPGWKLEEIPEQAGNYGIFASEPGTFSRLEGGVVYDNAVWRINFLMQGTLGVSFNWRYALEPYTIDGEQVEDSRFQVITGTDQNTQIRQIQGPILNFMVAPGFRHPARDTWHTYEISTYENHTQVWLDGRLIMERKDEGLLPPGTIGLEVWADTADKVAIFDNLAVCELSGPFESIVVLE